MATDRPITEKMNAALREGTPRQRVDDAQHGRPARQFERIYDIRQNLAEPPKVDPKHSVERVRPAQHAPQRELTLGKLDLPQPKPSPRMAGYGSYSGPLRNPVPLRFGDPGHAPKADVDRMLRSNQPTRKTEEPVQQQPQRKRDERDR